MPIKTDFVAGSHGNAEAMNKNWSALGCTVDKKTVAPIGYVKISPKSRDCKRSLSGFTQLVTIPAYMDRTYQSTVSCETAYSFVRFKFYNGESVQRTLSGVYCGNTTDISQGKMTAATIVTFGGSETVAIAPAKVAGVPSYVVSDWIPMQSAPRVDGGTLPCVSVRAYIPSGSGISHYSGASSAGGSWGTGGGFVAGRVWKNTSATGNLTSHFGTGLIDVNYGGLCVDVDFKASKPCHNITAIGDSITNGDAATESMESPVHYACTQISNSNNPVSYSNKGYSAKNTTNFLDRLTFSIDIDCSAVVYSSFSPNDITGDDTTNIAMIESIKPRVESAIAECRRVGVPIILSTGLPYTWNTPTDNARKSFNSWVRSLANNYDVFLVDYDVTLSDGATPARIKAGRSGDTLHPNSTGYIEMGNSLAIVLSTILSW